MGAIRALREIVAEKTVGPKPDFSLSNLVRTILTIDATKGIGRSSLAREVGIGEGAVRTVIDRLKKKGLISVTAKGCDLTRKGEKLYSELSRKLIKLANVDGRELDSDELYSAILVRGIQFSGRSLLDYRDTAIRTGARRSILVVSTEGRLTIPSVTDNAENHAPNLAQDLKKKFDLKDSDVIIVCGAPTYRDAEDASIAVALSMIEEMKRVLA